MTSADWLCLFLGRRSYLSLEKIRFEQRLKINFKVANQSLTFLVPPMLLQTLVENGIKHGISKLKAGGEITLTANIKNKILTIVIINDGEYNPKIGKPSGTGLNNSKKRIELLYTLTSQKCNFVSECVIDQQLGIKVVRWIEMIGCIFSF